VHGTYAIHQLSLWQVSKGQHGQAALLLTPQDGRAERGAMSRARQKLCRALSFGNQVPSPTRITTSPAWSYKMAEISQKSALTWKKQQAGLNLVPQRLSVLLSILSNAPERDTQD